MSETRTIAQAIEDAAKAEPGRGFRFTPESGVPGYTTNQSDAEVFYSFAAIERLTARFGGALQALGLKKGDRVALIVPNNDDFILSFLGAIRAGIVPVPIYPPMALGQLQSYLDNTRHIVAKSGARALVTSSKIKRLLGTVQEECPALEQIAPIEPFRESSEPLRPERITLDDLAFLQFTSGSTSRPKGVTLTHANLAANIDCIMGKAGLAIGREDIAVSWLPLYHDMGLIGFVLSPLFYEVPTTYLPPLLFLKRPVTWFQTFTRTRGTIAFAPNFAFALCVKRIREADLERIDLSTWRLAGCGAEPIRPETLEAFCDSFGKVGFRKTAVYPCFGMAESSLAVAFTELDEGLKTLSVDSRTLWEQGLAKQVPEEDEGTVRLVSCGPAFPMHDIQVFDPTDLDSATPLSEGVVGEIRITGPSVMKSYWDDAERTRKAFAGDYLRTGDLGFLLDKHLYICGRSKEVVIVNGRNYYPQDMEWEASQVPGVRKGNIVAFGARDPNERDRERIVVAFEVQDAARVSDSAGLIALVKKAVQDGMGLVVDDALALAPGSLPKTSSGKLQRAKTREMYESGFLGTRPVKREASPLDLMKHAAASQLSFFKLAVLGGRKKKD
jgi:fatty-acyl-CoA synthase